MTTQPPDAADRVERLEAFAFRAGEDLAEIKTRLDRLPSQVRQEILEYTAPVLGEIMAGRATLATQQDIQALGTHMFAVEQRLGEQIQALGARFDKLLDALGKQD